MITGRIVRLIWVGLAFITAFVCSSATVAKHERVTRYPGFERVCYAFIQALAEKDQSAASLVLREQAGDCAPDKKPLVFSVTHENPENTHEGAANNNLKVPAHVADFDAGLDLGRWLDARISDKDPAMLSLTLNALNFADNETTGWPLKYGRIMLAARDELLRRVPLSQDIHVILEYRMRVDFGGLASRDRGARMMVGARAHWQETDRANTAHFVEFDIQFSDGYGGSFKERSPSPSCDARIFNRCFFDRNGKYAEGREYRYSCERLGESGWSRCQIPLSVLVRSAGWFSPPKDWSEATVGSIYIGIESTGPIITTADIRNYDVYVDR